MHIPDGYLSPSTSIVLITVCTPFLSKASNEAKKALNSKTIPLISLFSALSFIIMMLNIPLPGGTTGHAVGSVIASIILGPWVAMLTITVALIIQALFFGDGGILALGANIFNMAIAMPLIGFFVYHLLDKWSYGSIKRKIIFSAISGYIAINVAAFLTGFELGIQPILFHNSSGQSLFFPFNLSVSVPSMMIGHLTLAGLAEGIITGLTLSWIYKTNPDLIILKGKKFEISSKSYKWLYIFLGVLLFVTPLGILAPGTAWGEWGREELQNLGLGFMPAGFDKWSEIWRAPFPDYTAGFLKNPSVAYIFSGIFGVFTLVVVFLIPYLIHLLIKRMKQNHKNKYKN
jgi:cobalt/nickel transport system permease protein